MTIQFTKLMDRNRFPLPCQVPDVNLLKILVGESNGSSSVLCVFVDGTGKRESSNSQSSLWNEYHLFPYHNIGHGPGSTVELLVVIRWLEVPKEPQTRNHRVVDSRGGPAG